jgi:hypothetical protein
MDTFMGKDGDYIAFDMLENKDSKLDVIKVGEEIMNELDK